MELAIAYYARRHHEDKSMAPSRNISSMLRDSKASEHPYHEFDA